MTGDHPRLRCELRICLILVSFLPFSKGLSIQEASAVFTTVIVSTPRLLLSSLLLFLPFNTLVLRSLNNNCRLPTSNTSSHSRLPHTQQHHGHTNNNTTKMRSTPFSATAALLSALTLVNAQTFTSCNPTTNCTCRFPLVSRDAPLTRVQQAVPPTQV